jgi:hypothetical protein
MTYLNSTPPNNLCYSAILDSGATGNFLAFDAPCIHKEKVLHPLSVTLPDGTIIESTNTAMLVLPGLPPSAKKAHLSLTILNIPSSQLVTSATMDVKCHFLHPVSQSVKGEPLSFWGRGNTPQASGKSTSQLNPLAPCSATTQLTMSTNSDPFQTPLLTSMQRVSAPSRTPGSMPSRRETLLDGLHYRQTGCANTCTNITLL